MLIDDKETDTMSEADLRFLKRGSKILQFFKHAHFGQAPQNSEAYVLSTDPYIGTQAGVTRSFITEYYMWIKGIFVWANALERLHSQQVIHL